MTTTTGKPRQVDGEEGSNETKDLSEPSSKGDCPLPTAPPGREPLSQRLRAAMEAYSGNNSNSTQPPATPSIHATTDVNHMAEQSTDASITTGVGVDGSFLQVASSRASRSTRNAPSARDGMTPLRRAPRTYQTQTYREKRRSQHRAQQQEQRRQRQNRPISGVEAFAIERGPEESQPAQQYPGAYSVPGGFGNLRNEEDVDEDEEDIWQQSTQERQHRSGFFWKHRKRFVGVCVVLFLLVAVVSLSLVLTASSNNNNSEEDREQARISFLRDTLDHLSATSSGTSVWDDSSSAQSQALHWLAHEEYEENTITTERIITRYVLAVLYFSTNHDVDSWKQDSYSFLSPQHECDWNNNNLDVVKNRQGSVGGGGVNCDSSLVVSSIVIDNNHLRGVIPNELTALSQLETLSLRKNQLSGSIPETLFELTRLTMLDLSENELVSSFSSGIRYPSSLKTLRLGHNQLSGSLMKGISGLTELIEVNVTHNHFPEELFESFRGIGRYTSHWNLLAHLEVLDLSHCAVIGRFNLRRHSGLENLKLLYVGGNSLQGPFPAPSFYTTFPSLEVFSGYQNQFTGTFPWPSSEESPNLKTIIMSDNLLSKALPATFNANLPRLEHLDFSNNPLTSSIPDSIGALTILKTLVVSHGGLTGTVPSSLGNLGVLQTLDLSENNLQGKIPIQVSNCSHLEELVLHDNQMSGEIPEELSRLSNLRRATFQANNLTGRVDFLCNDSEISGIGADCLGDSPKIIPCTCCDCLG